MASVGHFFEFAKEGGEVLSQVINIVIFTIPGVIVGGQLGPKLQKVIPEDIMKIAISIAFVIIGIFMFITLI